MDYVVYGTGYGATLMLLGYALRTWGPKWRYRDEDERAFVSGELRAARAAWSRFTTGLGAVLATCGVVLILFTFALMLANPGDGVSEMVSLIISGLLLVGVAVWAWLYFSRFGAFGVTRSPAALMSQATAPIRYDDRQTQAVPAPATESSATEDDELMDDEEDESDVEEIVEDVYEPDEDEIAETEVRYSKFETHHPAEDRSDAPDEAPVGEEEVDVAGTTVESATPDVEESSEAVDVESVAEVEVAPAAVRDTDAPEAAASEAVEEDNVIEKVAVDAGEPVNEDVEEAMEPSAVVESAGTSTPAESESRSGRDDALQRLRERQASRTRRTDDA